MGIAYNDKKVQCCNYNTMEVDTDEQERMISEPDTNRMAMFIKKVPYPSLES